MCDSLFCWTLVFSCSFLWLKSTHQNSRTAFWGPDHIIFQEIISGSPWPLPLVGIHCSFSVPLSLLLLPRGIGSLDAMKKVIRNYINIVSYSHKQLKPVCMGKGSCYRDEHTAYLGLVWKTSRWKMASIGTLPEVHVIGASAPGQVVHGSAHPKI